MGAPSPAIEFDDAIGDPPSIQLLPVARLEIDKSYQRALSALGSQRLIQDIARKFDWRLFLPLVVSRREGGGLYVIDGQHRMEGARLRGDIRLVPCTVIEGLSQVEEAKLFCSLNGKRKPISALDLWRSAVMSGDPDAVTVAAIVSDAKLLVVDASRDRLKPGEINTIGPIKTAIRAYGEQTAGDALAIIASAFRDCQMQSIGMFLSSACAMLRCGDSKDQVRAAFAMKRPLQWVELARADPVYLKGASGMQLALRRAIDKQIGRHRAGHPATVVAPVFDPRRGPGDAPQAAPLPTGGGVAHSSPTSLAPQQEPPSFEEQLAKIASGQARAVPTFKPSRPDPAGTLGGIGSAAL